MNDIQIDRVAPHNLEAEEWLLSACIAYQDSLANMSEVIEIIEPDDFYKETHSLIFSAMLDIYGKNIPMDPLILCEELEKSNTLEKIGGMQYLEYLAEIYVTPASTVHYAKIIKNDSNRRKLISSSHKIFNDAFDNDIETDVLLDKAENSILGIKDSGVKQFVHAKTLIMGTIEAITKAYTSKTEVSGLPTGFIDLDRLTTGLYPGDYVVVAGRTSMGKSVLVKDIAMNLAFKEHIPVGFFTLETSKEQLMFRIMSSLSGISGFMMKTGNMTEKEYSNVIRVANTVYESNLYIDDSSGLTDMELRSRIRRMKYQHGIELVIVDYISQLRSHRKTESRQQEISEISNSMKCIAKDFKIPIIVVVQINRGPEGRADKRPMLSDLRESGSIEQDADTVCLIYRDSYYNKDNPDNTTEIILAKQRNGPTGTIKLYFDEKCTKFSNLEKQR